MEKRSLPLLRIVYRTCGKILFAKNESELPGLEEIWSQAHQNGVPNLTRLSKSQLNQTHAFVRSFEAFHSPDTSILDVSSAVKKIADRFENSGGMIARNCTVKSLEKNASYIITTDQFEITSEYVINAAGFYGPKLRGMLGLKGLESFLVKGNYISTFQKLDHPHLFYPVPPKDLKGLGVHSTMDLEGKIKFGPNTEDTETVDYKDACIALKAMTPEILNTFVGIDEKKLYWDYCGIRSKLIHTETNKLETDFLIQSPLPGYIECLGIESPGLTSSPAIAKKIIRDFF